MAVESEKAAAVVDDDKKSDYNRINDIPALWLACRSVEQCEHVKFIVEGTYGSGYIERANLLQVRYMH